MNTDTSHTSFFKTKHLTMYCFERVPFCLAELAIDLRMCQAHAGWHWVLVLTWFCRYCTLYHSFMWWQRVSWNHRILKLDLAKFPADYRLSQPIIMIMRSPEQLIAYPKNDSGIMRWLVCWALTKHTATESLCAPTGIVMLGFKYMSLHFFQPLM
jgi:hypothetical protein